jgi:hypothetical protein
MKNYRSPQTEVQRQILNRLYIDLLKQFQRYNSNANKLLCSYMSAGQKYKNELLVIGREPLYWREEFSPEEISVRGPEYVFDNKVLQPGLSGLSSSCRYNILYNSLHDPIWMCIKDVVINLGICQNKENWSSCIALTYLYKLAYCNKEYLSQKPMSIQFEYCREMLHLELSILKPKRVLFLTGMNFAQQFLKLPRLTALGDNVCSLGEYDYGLHKAQTVITINPRNCPRKELVNLILKRFS